MRALCDCPTTLAAFLQDGVETGNLIDGNLAILTRASNALLNVDTTPASFWITNPNNTVRNNRATGSAAYGFWYHLLGNSEGEPLQARLSD